MNSEQMKQFLALHADLIAQCDYVEAVLLDRTDRYWYRDEDDGVRLGVTPDFPGYYKPGHYQPEHEEFAIDSEFGVADYIVIGNDRQYEPRLIILDNAKQVPYVKPEPPPEHKFTPDEQAAHDEWIRMSDEKRREIGRMLQEWMDKQAAAEPNSSMQWKVGDRVRFTEDFKRYGVEIFIDEGRTGTIVEFDEHGNFRIELDEEYHRRFFFDDECAKLEKLPSETSTGDTP